MEHGLLVGRITQQQGVRDRAVDATGSDMADVQYEQRRWRLAAADSPELPAKEAVAEEPA